jgi:hypothetical protein
MYYCDLPNLTSAIKIVHPVPVLWIRVRMFLGHPDPLDRGMDPDSGSFPFLIKVLSRLEIMLAK